MRPVCGDRLNKTPHFFLMRDIYLTTKVAELAAVVRALATNVAMVKATLPGTSTPSLVTYTDLTSFRAATSSSLSTSSTVLLLADVNGLAGLFRYTTDSVVDDGGVYVIDASSRAWERISAQI